MLNNWYSLFKAVHVLFAVIWVGGGVSIMIHAIRGAAGARPGGDRHGREAGGVHGREGVRASRAWSTFLMGIAMMINTSWGWGHFWIVAGLIGYASTFIVGVAILSPLAKKIDESAEKNGPTASGDDRADRADHADRALRRRHADARRARHGHEAVRVIPGVRRLAAPDTRSFSTA